MLHTCNAEEGGISNPNFRDVQSFAERNLGTQPKFTSNAVAKPEVFAAQPAASLVPLAFSEPRFVTQHKSSRPTLRHNQAGELR